MGVLILVTFSQAFFISQHKVQFWVLNETKFFFSASVLISPPFAESQCSVGSYVSITAVLLPSHISLLL